MRRRSRPAKLLARQRVRIGTALLLATSLNFSALPQANAATGWRYWGYFQAAPAAMSWSYALTGPTGVIRDGAVEGWAFTFSGDDVPEAAAPKTAPHFKKICGSTAAVVGKKRVGLVIDFGSAALRPRGEKLPRALIACLVLDKGATGVDVLNAAAKVRYAASGYVCGINNYPIKECGAEITTPRLLLKNLAKK